MKKDYRGRTNWKLVDPEYPHTSKQPLHRQYKRPIIIAAVVIVLVLIIVGASLLHKSSPKVPAPTPPSTISIPLQIPSAHS